MVPADRVGERGVGEVGKGEGRDEIHDCHHGEIACGKYGCQRIPPNCHPETDYYWNGLPTGYDRVVCR
jgi:hypothetical protein